MKVKDFEERLNRYKRWYPEHCDGKDDIEILLHCNIINQDQARKMRKVDIELPKIVVKKPKKKMMTEKKFRKLMKDVATDMLNQGQEIDDCGIDIAESILWSNPDLMEYVRKQLSKDASSYDINLFIAENIG